MQLAIRTITISRMIRAAKIVIAVAIAIGVLL